MSPQMKAINEVIGSCKEKGAVAFAREWMEHQYGIKQKVDKLAEKVDREISLVYLATVDRMRSIATVQSLSKKADLNLFNLAQS